jgi:uncharacterized protein
VPGVFLTAEWRHLLAFNYPADPALLARWLPAGTELDLVDGQAVLSIVGFYFLNASVLKIPIPFHRSFEEVNLRFYVRRREGTSWKRGVVFIREIVPKRLISLGAKLFYNENYSTLPMLSTLNIPGPVRYEWSHRGGLDRMGADVVGNAKPMESGSFEQYIFENYWGFTKQRDGSTKEYLVEHPQWQVHDVAMPTLNARVASVYGDEFVPYLTAVPPSAMFAVGSPVSVRWVVKLPDTVPVKKKRG